MTTVAPGWYPDPQGVTRWWDGQAWTQHVAPPPPAYHQQPSYGYASVMITRSRKQTNHTFHLLMTLITFGAWGLFVWLPVTIYNSMRHDKTLTRMG